MKGARAGPRAARHRALLQGLAAGGRAAHADEQPRPRRRRAARRPRRLRRHRPRRALVGGVRRDRPRAAGARGRRDAARAVGQAGRRDAHARVGAARADRQLQPRAGVGDVGRVPPPRGPRADDVRADDRGVVDLHRHPGHRAGHLRVLRRDRPAALRRLAGRHDHADRRARRDGRRAAAGGDHERRRRAVRGDRRVADPAAARDALPRRAGRRPRRRGGALPRRRATSGGRCSVGLLGNAAEVLPRLLRPASRPTSSPTRRARTTRSAATCRTGCRRRRPTACGATTRDEYVRRSRAAMAAHCAAMVGFMDRGAEVFDYGNSLRAEAKLGGFERAFDYPGFVPAYVRPLFCEGKGPFRWVALSGDPADIAATDRAVLEEFPDDERLARWIREAGEKIAFQGLPARICWLGYGERRRLGLRFNEMVRERRAERAGRDRARPPRLGLGRLALPRDRGDGRRVRRDRRLAAAQRARQHVLGRVVGVDPPRRRRRHRALDPRRAWCAWPTAPSWRRRSSTAC